MKMHGLTNPYKKLCSTQISLSFLFQVSCFPNCQYFLDVA